ncbi:MAG: hypothetical protein PHN19_01025 [Patescibacteria group bacterium]|nr:hypothetical protein [Patescibacteria group bacterium]
MTSIIKNFTLFFAFCLTFLLGLAVFGWFNKITVSITILSFIIGFLVWIFLKKQKIKIERTDLIIFGAIVVFSLLVSFFHHGIPSGRDDASYMSAAIKLTETGSLSFTDQLIHAYSGFRNLEGNVFTSQFLPGYNVYLAVYFLFGGINAMLWANCLLLVLFLSLIYFLVSDLANKKTALFSLLLLGTFYTTFWFTKRLNSENLFMVFFWLGILLFFEGLKNKRISNLFFSLYSLLFCIFIRAEALLYFLIAIAVFFIIMFVKKLRTNHFGYKIKLGWNFLVCAGITVFALISFGAYLQKYNGLAYFYKQFYDPWKLFSKVFLVLFIVLLLGAILYYFLKKYTAKSCKDAIDYLLKNGQRLIFVIVILSACLYELVLFLKCDDLAWSFYQIQFNFKALGFYLVLFYLVLILIGLYKKVFKKEELLLVLLCLPSFLFLFRSQIAIDQPWFMRRFYPIFIPLIFILSAMLWYRLDIIKSSLTFFVKKAIIILIIGNFLISLPIIFYRENAGVDKELKKFSQQFKDSDLIVMNPGWSWQKWSYALHYLYNVNVIPRRELYSKKEFLVEAKKYEKDLDNDDVIVKLKTFLDEKSFETLQKLVKNYDSVYLLNSKDDMIVYPYKNDNLELKSSFSFDYQSLSSDSLLIKYLKNKEIPSKKVANRIYNTPPVLPTENTLSLNLYKALDKNILFLSERVYDAKAIAEFRDYLSDSLETNF